MSNKSDGTAFEKEFAELLSKHGFWVHRLQDNTNGQPFDIIAARNGKAFVIDCKECQGKTFVLSRMEENQRLSMELWEETGNTTGRFALRFGGKVYLLTLGYLDGMRKKGRKQITEKDCQKYGTDAEWWMLWV